MHEQARAQPVRRTGAASSARASRRRAASPTVSSPCVVGQDLRRVRARRWRTALPGRRRIVRPDSRPSVSGGPSTGPVVTEPSSLLSERVEEERERRAPSARDSSRRLRGRRSDRERERQNRRAARARPSATRAPALTAALRVAARCDRVRMRAHRQRLDQRRPSRQQDSRGTLSATAGFAFDSAARIGEDARSESDADTREISEARRSDAIPSVSPAPPLRAGRPRSRRCSRPARCRWVASETSAADVLLAKRTARAGRRRAAQPSAPRLRPRRRAPAEPAEAEPPSGPRSRRLRPASR